MTGYKIFVLYPRREIPRLSDHITYLYIPEYDGINVSISGELISRRFSERERERPNESFKRKLTVSICTRLLSGSLTDVSFMKFMKIDEIKMR